MSDIVEALVDVVGAAAVSAGEAIHDDYTHDEALTAIPQRPLAVVRPATPPRWRASSSSRPTPASPLTARVRVPGSPVRAFRPRAASSCRSNA